MTEGKIQISAILNLDEKKPRIEPISELERKKTPANVSMLALVTELNKSAVPCTICGESDIGKDACDLDILLCGHTFCSSCIDKHVTLTKESSKHRCPNCRTPMRVWKRFFKTHLQNIDNYVLASTEVNWKRIRHIDRKTVLGKYASKELQLLIDAEELSDAMPAFTSQQMSALCFMRDYENHCKDLIAVREKVNILSSLNVDLKSYGPRKRAYIQRQLPMLLQIQNNIELAIDYAKSRMEKLVSLELDVADKIHLQLADANKNTQAEHEEDGDDEEEDEEDDKKTHKRIQLEKGPVLRKRVKKDDEDDEYDPDGPKSESDDDELSESDESSSSSSSDEYRESDDEEQEEPNDALYDHLYNLAKEVKRTSFARVFKRIKDTIV